MVGEAWRREVRHRVYRRLARSPRRVHGHGPLVVAIGDSHTDPSTGYTLPRQVWLRQVGRTGYRTLNLGVSGETTGDMRERIGRTLDEGRPEIVVVFGGGNDAVRGVDPAETQRNVAEMLDWLRDHGVGNIILIGPGILNWKRAAAWAPAVDEVRAVLGEVASGRGATFVDLAGFLHSRIDRGEDPDFARVPYRQSRSWHVQGGDAHFNAYGQRLIAEAVLAVIDASGAVPAMPAVAALSAVDVDDLHGR